MSDLTVYAEALIATVARAFYTDDAVCLIDVLIRDKFLRDDDMAVRLSLPAKKLRSTLLFLQQEHLVKLEELDDLNEGGSQVCVVLCDGSNANFSFLSIITHIYLLLRVMTKATKFWYIDYNHAVHSIRLRLHMLRTNLEKAELHARSNSFYLCPGYKTKRCNGRYTEEEAQQVVDPHSGLFLCQECVKIYDADPNPPSVTTYTLQLVDNTRDLKQAIDNKRRVNVQLSAKMIGNYQLRPGIYDLLQKVRGKGKQPITSNLPSENYELGIGSKRLAGTGRTAGSKAKKLEQQGVADSATTAQHYLVGGGTRYSDGSELTFLKNALGNEIAFAVEKGGGARANLLASRRRRRRKLMDEAASRIGASLPLYLRMREKQKRKEEEQRENANKKQKKETPGLEFLANNIGMIERDEELEKLRRKEQLRKEKEAARDAEESEAVIVLVDETEEMRRMPDEERQKAFQTLYKVEMGRQLKLLDLETDGKQTATDDEEEQVVWMDA